MEMVEEELLFTETKSTEELVEVQAIAACKAAMQASTKEEGP